MFLDMIITTVSVFQRGREGEKKKKKTKLYIDDSTHIDT